MFKFTGVKPAEETTFLKPGIYAMKPAKFAIEIAKSSKNPMLKVTFITQDEVEFTENFPLSEGAIPRIVYLHHAWTNKTLEKDFKSAEEVAEYFQKLFCSPKKPAPPKLIIVGGEISAKDGKVYGRLPFTNFVAPDGTKLGEFTEGDENWKKYVKKQTVQANASTGKGNGIINDSGASNTAAGGGFQQTSNAFDSKSDEQTDTGGEDEDRPW